jgi:hypothetical protein
MATLLANNNADGGSNGTTVTAGNSGGASGTAFDVVTIDASGLAVFDNAHAAHGPFAYKITGSGSGGARFEWDTTQTTIYGRAYILAGSFPAGVTAFIDARNTGLAPAASLRLTATPRIALYDSTGNPAATGTTTLLVNVIYRVEFKVVFSATVGTMTVNLYLGDATTALETIAATALNTNTQMTAMLWSWRPFTTDIFYFDSLNLNTTGFPGPVAGTGFVGWFK